MYHNSFWALCVFFFTVCACQDKAGDGSFQAITYDDSTPVEEEKGLFSS
jgi:hypothetical protein